MREPRLSRMDRRTRRQEAGAVRDAADETNPSGWTWTLPSKSLKILSTRRNSEDLSRPPLCQSNGDGP